MGTDLFFSNTELNVRIPEQDRHVLSRIMLSSFGLDSHIYITKILLWIPVLGNSLLIVSICNPILFPFTKN
jgi:hypothetical protein